MPQLDNYLVSLGLKGQNAVLSTMDKIRKKGKDISKKSVTVSTKIKPEKAGKPETKPKIKSKTKSETKPETKPETPSEEKTGGKFGKAVDKFSRHANRFADAASSLNPSSLIQSIASTLPYLGAVAAAAGGALLSAKSSTAGAYELARRNAAVKFYGGESVWGRDSRKQGFMSNQEHAMFISAVSSSMGKVQRPLADAINNLINKKDTQALARAAAGDWESTGTDKGWMIAQMMSGTEGLPPSIRQKLSAAMLKNFGSEIQNVSEDQRTRQQRATYFENAQETQTTRLADTAATAQFRNAAGEMVNSIEAMNDALNTMQNAMVKGAGKMVTAISFITDTAVNSKNGHSAGTLDRFMEIFK